MAFHNKNALILALLIFVIDRITKILFSSLYTLGQSVPVIQNVFHFTLIHNRGAGFGILQGGRIFFIIFSVIVLIGVIYKWKDIPQEKHSTYPLGLILGGLLGNLYDRAFFGYVIDFFDFRVWPVFNIADSAITIAAIWILLAHWKK